MKRKRHNPEQIIRKLPSRPSRAISSASRQIETVASHTCCLRWKYDNFEQAPRVDRPPPSLCSATASFLPATQGQR